MFVRPAAWMAMRSEKDKGVVEMVLDEPCDVSQVPGGLPARSFRSALLRIRSRWLIKLKAELHGHHSDRRTGRACRGANN